MDNVHIQPLMATGANKTYIYLGFCPDVVEVVNATERVTGLWHRLLGNLYSVIRIADGTGTLETDEGISLVQFKKPGVDLDSDPTVVTDPNLADGILIADDWGAGTGLTDGDLLWVKAYRASIPWVYAKHDGGDAEDDLEDSSVDFLEAGVSGGQQWIAINLTNKDCAYVGEVVKPFGESKYSRCTLVNASGTAIGATAADVDDDDEFLLMPKNCAQYPLSDIGLMS